MAMPDFHKPIPRSLRVGDPEFDEFVSKASRTGVPELAAQLKDQIRVGSWTGDPKLLDMVMRLSALRVAGAQEGEQEERALRAFAQLMGVVTQAMRVGARGKKQFVEMTTPNPDDLRTLRLKGAVREAAGGAGA